MYKKKKIFAFLIHLVLYQVLMCCSLVSAQPGKADSIQGMIQQRTYNIYEYTKNPGTIPYSGWVQAGFAAVNIYSTTGEFKRPMEPYQTRSIAAATGGYRRLNQWGFSGTFAYQKTFDEKLAWSNVYKPYEGNPFLWADSNSGNWIKDEVKAHIAIAVPPAGSSVHTGLAVDYLAGSGARTNEPKPFYRVRDIAVRPGVYWQLSPKHSIGLTAGLSFVQEENETGFYSNRNVLLFRLRGYGTFSRSPLVTGNRRRTGHESSVTLHYERTWNQKRFLIYGLFSNRQEEVFEGTAIKAVTGNYAQYKWQGGLSLYKGHMAKGSSLTATFNQCSGYADDYAYRAESANHFKREWKLNWSSWNTSQNRRVWQWIAAPVLSETALNDHATRTSLNVVRTGASASVNYRTYISPRWVIDLLPLLDLSRTIKKTWSNATTNSIIKELVFPDYEFLAANYAGANMQINIELHSSDVITHRFSLKHTQRLTLQNSGNRNFSQLQYSIFF